MTPRLETPRLILREHRLEDFPAYAAISADPQYCRQVGIATQNEEGSWMRFLARIGQWALMGYGYWAVEEKASGRFIGGVGFQYSRREMGAEGGEDPEIGWGFACDVHGRGFGTEAVMAIVAWGDAVLPGARTWCIIDPANLASQRLAARAGYRHIGDTSYKGRTLQVLERIRS